MSEEPKPSNGSVVVGRFRSGRIEGRTPVALDKWCVTTGDPAVADVVANVLGSDVREWETQGEDNLEVLADASSVQIVPADTSAIASELKLWGPGGVITHHCDGVTFLDDRRKGKPCGCLELLTDRKAMAKIGRGPKPDVSITFRLLAAPRVGMFRIQSGSWDLARVLEEYLVALDDVAAQQCCSLILETTSFVPRGSPMKGMTVSYTKPVLKVHGPYEKGARALRRRAGDGMIAGSRSVAYSPTA